MCFGRPTVSGLVRGVSGGHQRRFATEPDARAYFEDALNTGQVHIVPDDGGVISVSPPTNVRNFSGDGDRKDGSGAGAGVGSVGSVVA